MISAIVYFGLMHSLISWLAQQEDVQRLRANMGSCTSTVRGMEVLNLHGRHSGTRIKGSPPPSICPSVTMQTSPASWPYRAKTFRVRSDHTSWRLSLESAWSTKIWQQNSMKFKLSTVQCKGVVGMARTGFWRGGYGMISDLVQGEGDFGLAGVSRDHRVEEYNRVLASISRWKWFCWEQTGLGPPKQKLASAVCLQPRWRGVENYSCQLYCLRCLSVCL